MAAASENVGVMAAINMKSSKLQYSNENSGELNGQ